MVGSNVQIPNNVQVRNRVWIAQLCRLQIMCKLQILGYQCASLCSLLTMCNLQTQSRLQTICKLHALKCLGSTQVPQYKQHACRRRDLHLLTQITKHCLQAMCSLNDIFSLTFNSLVTKTMLGFKRCVHFKHTEEDMNIIIGTGHTTTRSCDITRY